MPPLAKHVITDIAGETHIVEPAGIIQSRDGFLWFHEPGAFDTTPPQYVVAVSSVHTVERID